MPNSCQNYDIPSLSQLIYARRQTNETKSEHKVLSIRANKLSCTAYNTNYCRNIFFCIFTMYADRVWYHMTQPLSHRPGIQRQQPIRCNPIRLLRKFRNGSAIIQGLAYMIRNMKSRKRCNWTLGVFRRKRFVFTPATILFAIYNNEVYLTISGTGLTNKIEI